MPAEESGATLAADSWIFFRGNRRKTCEEVCRERTGILSAIEERKLLSEERKLKVELENRVEMKRVELEGKIEMRKLEEEAARKHEAKMLEIKVDAQTQSEEET